MQNKQTAKMLLWIAVITLLAHDLIPHHHDSGMEQFVVNGVANSYAIQIEKPADSSDHSNEKPACCMMNQDFLIPSNQQITTINYLNLEDLSLKPDQVFYLPLSQLRVHETRLLNPFPADSVPLLHSNINLPQVLRGPPVV